MNGVASALISVVMLASPTWLPAQRAGRPFDDRFRILDSVVLQSTSAAPIARISGVAVTRDGRFIVSDISEGTVRLYGRGGQLQSQIGGKGSGPGGFRAPVLPRIDRSERLHIPDIGLQRVTVLELAPDGKATLVRTVSVARAVRAIFGFELLPSGEYLVTGAGQNQTRALFVLDSTGALRASYLDIRAYTRGPAVEPGVWDAITVPTVATDGRSAFVVLSTFDSLWTVDVASGHVTSGSIPLVEYRPPAAPNKPFTSRNERREWATSQTVLTVFASPRHLFVPVFRGTYNEGVVSDVAYRRSGGNWNVYKGMPTILGIRGDTLFALKSAEDNATVLRVLIKE